jgi:hypothetical protein
MIASHADPANRAYIFRVSLKKEGFRGIPKAASKYLREKREKLASLKTVEF